MSKNRGKPGDLLFRYEHQVVEIAAVKFGAVLDPVALATAINAPCAEGWEYMHCLTPGFDQRIFAVYRRPKGESSK